MYLSTYCNSLDTSGGLFGLYGANGYIVGAVVQDCARPNARSF